MSSTGKRIALIPGDGIGREVVPIGRRVLEALPIDWEFVELEAGWATFERTGTALPQATLAGLRGCDGALFGAVNSPVFQVEGYNSPIVAMRKELDLFANLRPVASVPVANCRQGIDMLIVRENTECLYVKQERLEDGGTTAVAQRVITRKASDRIARVAFEAAVRRGRQPHLVTIVHKANVLSVTDGLFRQAALDAAKDFPQVTVEEQLVDSMLYRMIREPERYDVVLAPNLYGDILSDGAAALVGGLGVAPSANAGDAFVMVEPVHGSAPDIAGQGIANPTATVLAVALLLDLMALGAMANAVRSATDAALREGVLTPDLGGEATTEQVGACILAHLAAELERL